MNEERRGENNDQPTEYSPRNGMSVPDDFLVEIQTRSLDEKVGEHRSEITFSGRNPMRKVHHGLVENS